MTTAATRSCSWTSLGQRGVRIALAAGVLALSAPTQAEQPSPAATTTATPAAAQSPTALPPATPPSPSATIQSPPPTPESVERQRTIDKAAALHDEARALYQQGEYRAAIVRLRAALELDPEGKELVYNLAVIHEKLGEIDDAEQYYRRYLDMETQPKEREQVEAVLRRLRGAKRELARPAPAPAVPPPSARRSPPPPAPPAPHAWARPVGPWVIVSGSLAAGALIVGNVFAMIAVSRDPGSSGMTGHGVTIDQLRTAAASAHRSAVVADVALLMATLAGGAAVYLYLKTPPRIAPAQPPPRVAHPRTAARHVSGNRAGAGPWIGVTLSASSVQLQVRF